MTGERLPQRGRCALIEEDSHLRGGKGAAGGVFENRAQLGKTDTREKLNELFDGYTVLEVLEQGGDRDARTPKNPGSANALGVAFHSFT